LFLWKGSLERDPQVMCKNMLVAGRVLRQACSLTILTIDRDYPPDCTHLSKWRPATGQVGQPLLPPCRASCSISPGRYIISVWAERVR
jgi:hypothetical protein